MTAVPNIDLYPKLQTYSQCIQKWNKHFSLVSPSLLSLSIEKQTEKSSSNFNTLWDHLQNSLCLYPYILSIYRTAQKNNQPHQHSIRVGDLGSGSGLLGLTLSIALENYPIQWTLIERNQKKAAFLNYCLGVLSLPKVHVFTGDAKNHKDHYDVLIAKAFGSLDKLINLSTILLYKNAVGFFLKGACYKQEMIQEMKTDKNIRIISSTPCCDTVILQYNHS